MENIRLNIEEDSLPIKFAWNKPELKVLNVKKTEGGTNAGVDEGSAYNGTLSKA